eukprot:1313224-Rhodomonas_salina.1
MLPIQYHAQHSRCPANARMSARVAGEVVVEEVPHAPEVVQPKEVEEPQHFEDPEHGRRHVWLFGAQAVQEVVAQTKRLLEGDQAHRVEEEVPTVE